MNFRDDYDRRDGFGINFLVNFRFFCLQMLWFSRSEQMGISKKYVLYYLMDLFVILLNDWLSCFGVLSGI